MCYQPRFRTQSGCWCQDVTADRKTISRYPSLCSECVWIVLKWTWYNVHDTFSYYSCAQLRVYEALSPCSEIKKFDMNLIWVKAEEIGIITTLGNIPSLKSWFCVWKSQPYVGRVTSEIQGLHSKWRFQSGALRSHGQFLVVNIMVGLTIPMGNRGSRNRLGAAWLSCQSVSL